MPFPSAGILDSFDNTLSGWASAWNLSGMLSISNGELVGVANSQTGCVWNSSFPSSDIECYVTLVNGIQNGSELTLRLANATIDAHGYLLLFQNYQDWVCRRMSDDWTSVVIGSGIHQTSAGEKIGIRRVNGVITLWHYTSGVWTQFATIDDNTYSDLAYVGITDYNGTNHYDDFGGGVVSASTLDSCLPDADIVTNGWTATPLYSKVNDVSDATVIQATAA